jgi:uncharacterized protein
MIEGAGNGADAGRKSFQPVEPGYKTVLRARMIVLWVPLTIGALVIERSLALPWPGLLLGAVVFLAIIAVIVAPQRIYARLGYRVGDRLLQVVRGWAFHTDTVVPFVRVQHLDVTRGPLDKLFGTASLVIHTAGTHNSIVTVPGLAPERAAEIRDIIREHVRTDFQ